MKNEYILPSLILAAAISGFGCKKDKKDDASAASVTLSGKVGTGFSLRGLALGGTDLTNATAVDQIWAIPLNGMSIGESSLNDKITIDLAADGSFSFKPANHGGSFVFALVNSTACAVEYKPGTSTEAEHDARRDCLIGYVSLPQFVDNVASNNPDANMYAFPFTEMKEDLDLGELSRVEAEGSPMNGDAQSEKNMEDEVTKFALDLNALKSIAKTDSMLKHIKNIYANNDNAVASGVKQSIAYKWFVPTDKRQAAFDTVKNQFATPSTASDTYPAFVGYHTYLDTDVNASVYQTKGEGSGEMIAIIPPGTVTFCSETTGVCSADGISTESPFKGNWPVIQSGAALGATPAGTNPMFAFSMREDGNLFGAITQMIGGVSPAGYWTFYMNPTKAGNIGDAHFLGKFDMRLAEPFAVKADGTSDVTKPIVFFPAVKLNVGDDNIVTGATVKFYIQEAGSFQEVDRAIVDKLVASPYFFIEGLDSCPTTISESSFHLGQGEDSITFPEGAFGFPGSGAGQCELPGIAATYNISGIAFSWHW